MHKDIKYTGVIIRTNAYEKTVRGSWFTGGTFSVRSPQLTARTSNVGLVNRSPDKKMNRRNATEYELK
jgi:hypothetical protein